MAVERVGARRRRGRADTPLIHEAMFRRRGQHGDVLVRDSGSPDGVSFRKMRMDMTDAQTLHPGILGPSAATGWIDIGPGHDIDFASVPGNDWEHAGSLFQTPQYRIDALGVLHLRGVVKKTDDTQVGGSVILNMPARLRPSPLIQLFTTPGVNSAGTRFQATISLNSSSAGNVFFVGPRDASGVLNVSLIGISYLVEA